MNIGGIGQYIASLTKALKERCVECIVVSSGGDLEAELQRNGIVHKRLDIDTKFFLSPKVFKAAFALAGIVKDEKVDLIHAHARVSQATAFIASRITGVPYISTCHGSFKPRLFRKLFDTWGQKVIAISGPVKIHLEKDFGIDEKRIELIHSGVDVNRFLKTSTEEKRSAKDSLGLKEGPVIGTMGRLSSVKGQRFLIDAMKHIISERKDAQCLIIGSGKEEKALKQLAGSLGISDNIKFIGSAYANMPLYLSIMDIFVLPSVQEGLGLALLEAMAAGLPCIGSDIGGISDVIKHEINGLKVPVGDPKAIAAATLRLLDDRALGSILAEKGREFVKEKFSVGKMTDKMIEVYEEVINAK